MSTPVALSAASKPPENDTDESQSMQALKDKLSALRAVLKAIKSLPSSEQKSVLEMAAADFGIDLGVRP